MVLLRQLAPQPGAAAYSRTLSLTLASHMGLPCIRLGWQQGPQEPEPRPAFKLIRAHLVA